MNVRVVVLAAACVVLWLTHPGGAYWLSGRQWAAGSDIVMHLQQGSPAGTPIDGSTSWNAVSEGALALWNPFLNDVSFRVVRDSTEGKARGNDVNNVFWDDDVYGDPFGDTTLAVTLSTWRLSDNTLIETDVIFNQGKSWNSYRGNLRNSSGGGRLYDLRRVALHEFGHALGLGHPDEHGQSVRAIMNSQTSNVDSLQTDDTDGARAIYGAPPVPNSAPTVTASCNPCMVETGQTTNLSAAATDPDGDSLTYQWSAPQGTFSDPNAASTLWTPSDPGNVTVTVTVEDGRGGRSTGTVALQVILRYRLQSGARLLPGQSLTSRNGLYRLLYQSDGNLVLYDDVNRTTPWTSGTLGTSAGQAVMQGDGNFVVYDAQGTPNWFTGTGGNPNASLVVQSDGNLVVYSADGQAVWDRISASTPAPTPDPTPTPTPTPTPGGTNVIDVGSSSLGALTRLSVPFTTTATGTIGATVDWTFATNDVDIYLTRGTDLCSIDQFNDDQCQFLGFTTSVSTKPETLSVSGLTAGPYTVYIVNWGSTQDSVGYQVTLASSPGASASSTPSTSVGGLKGVLSAESSRSVDRH